MARGVRTNATLLPTLSPVLQPQSIAAYDPVTRRNTILVATIVPTLAEADSLKSAHFLADRYYCVVGALQSASAVPDWMGGATNITFEQWDATDKQFYSRFAATASAGNLGDSVAPRFIYPVGLYGTATSHAPKNADVAAVWIKFTARFNVNTDYTVYGVGASSAQDFATGHFIQVTRNSGSWELTTRDGSTTSTSSDASADGNLHDFWVRWSATDAKLYVDGTLTITKSTNLPAQPLATGIYAENSTNTIDVVDYLIEWELA